MAIIHTVTRSYKDQSAVTIAKVESVSGNAEFNLDDAALAIVANHQYHLAFTRANLQSVALNSSDVVTVYTNNPSGSSPTDTIPLAAGQALVWSLATDGLGKCPFTADVTSIYVTNASSGTVAFKIRGLLNQ